MLFWCKCCNVDRRNPYSFDSRYRLYKKGIQKFEKELDIEYYTKSLRNLKIMVSAMMDDSERFMSVYQHCNSIPLFESLSESDSENEITKNMPNYTDK